MLKVLFSNEFEKNLRSKTHCHGLHEEAPLLNNKKVFTYWMYVDQFLESGNLVSWYLFEENGDKNNITY